MTLRVKGNYVIFSLVMLLSGFLISFSFQYAKETDRNERYLSESQWEEEEKLRNDVLYEQQLNRELTDDIREVQNRIKGIEEDISNQELTYFNMVEDIDRLRMVTGEVAVKGEGIQITLEDADYVLGDENPNNYIVHEHHIQQVVDELFIAGAEAVAINGHRINHQSYIHCVGPVIEVDGEVSFAPFEVTAIGDQEMLDESLNLIGGVKDQLVNENVQVRIEKLSEIMLNPRFSERVEDT
ncbi:DUF881 domain-containing protein [Salipaludibacillus keqinensis]|uniref:DUF881 domain-containing protein n=1 Tax=Salipaludibacillus keqinensis TaxID=2045207 RepID=UPI0018EE72DD|nr:DUF881 domain-containing protein [Salipaludibacillus keqinensis]